MPGFVDGSYYYDKQIKRLVLQFMAIFTDMKVAFGANDDAPAGRLVDVPIMFGRQDRVVANIVADGTRNLPIRPPLMSVNIIAIEQAKERYSGVDTVTREAYTPIGGLVPNDTRVVRAKRSVPHNLTIELCVLTSNTEQQWQILEQILILFEQELQIQTSDGAFDKAAVTSIGLEDVNLENNWPIGLDQKLDIAVLRFNAIAYLSTPVDIRSDMIERIKVRVGVVSTDTPLVDIANDMDAQQIPYQTVHEVSRETPI